MKIEEKTAENSQKQKTEGIKRISSRNQEIIFMGDMIMSFQKKIYPVTAAITVAATAFAGEFTNRKQNVIEKALPDDFYSRIAGGQSGRIFYPPFSDRKAWENIARTGFKAEQKKKLIAEAEILLNKPFESLSAYDYFRFILEGDRARFEQAYFRRRNDFAVLVMAMCLTGEREKYLPVIIDYLGAIMTEPYWCDHAHAPRRDNDPMPSLDTAENVDLFAAETAQQMALAFQILHEEIEKVSPRFARFCRETTLNHVVRPILKKKPHSWLTARHNWNPWCSANVLQTGAILLEDTAQLAELTVILNQSCSVYYEAYPDDGYCNEGPGYWFKSPVEFFHYCKVLEKLVPGCSKPLLTAPKVRNMGEFGPLMVIAGRDQVTSADCGHVFSNGLAAGLLYDYAEVIDSGYLRQFAIDRMTPDLRRRPITPEEAKICRFGTGCKLAWLLDYFFKLPEHPEKLKRVPLPQTSFWKDKMGIIRHADGFSVALKGGHNGENHNHNDLGHLTLYYKNRPLIIDLGTGMYSRKNFSSERYTLYYTNGSGHNALCFDKNIQQQGAEYTCALSMPDTRTLAVDLHLAYPAEAGVEKYIRTISCDEAEAVLTDEFQLKNKLPGVITFYTLEPVKKCSTWLDFGDGVFCELKDIHCESIEHVPLEEIPRHWGSKLWRITLKADAAKFSCRFTEPKNGLIAARIL